LDIGGENVTKDISVGLRTPLNEAERLKVEYGCTSTNSEGEEVNVPSVGLKKSRTVPRGVLAEIIGPRIEEIFLLINREIRMSGYENHIGGGVVLTGGSAQLEGVGELAEKVFGMPVRIGVPKGVGGLLDMVSAPEYAVVVGLLHYATKHKEGKKPSLMQLGIFKEAARRVKEWFLDLF
jgi:cell division protein FtsA